jgi:hypothetical protein
MTISSIARQGGLFLMTVALLWGLFGMPHGATMLVTMDAEVAADTAEIDYVTHWIEAQTAPAPKVLAQR